jgi:excisionase family DNA binding protein
MSPASAEPLLNMAQAIEALQTSRATLYRWLREGRIQGHKTGRQWRFKREEVDRFLEGAEPEIELPADIQPLLEALQEQLNEPYELTGEKLKDAFTLMVRVALERSATSLHMAPHHQVSLEATESCWIRMRVDGVLQPIISVDPRLVPPILNLWKRNAQCDVRCNDLPQDGLILLASNGELHELRASFLPGNFGESLTVKISNQSAAQPLLDDLKLPSRDHRLLQSGLTKRSRLIVISGPAGSSADCTLATCLREIAAPEVKLMTVEHPALRPIPWSVSLSPRYLGNSRKISTAILTMLRSDPDVLGTVNIPDAETATAVQDAVLNGPLVVAGLRADSASHALIRLSQLFENTSQLGQILDLIVTQRAIRLLCPKCRATQRLATSQRAQIELWMKAGGLEPSAERTCFQPVGCQACGGSGYRGRHLVTEALSITPAILRAVTNKELEKVEALAVEDGMVTLDARALKLVQEGETSLEEAGRFLPYFD